MAELPPLVFSVVGVENKLRWCVTSWAPCINSHCPPPLPNKQKPAKERWQERKRAAEKWVSVKFRLTSWLKCFSDLNRKSSGKMTCPQNAGIKKEFQTACEQLPITAQVQQQRKWDEACMADSILTSPLKVLIPVISSVSAMLLHNHGRSRYCCEPTTVLLLCRRFLSAFHLPFFPHPSLWPQL